VSRKRLNRSLPGTHIGEVHLGREQTEHHQLAEENGVSVGTPVEVYENCASNILEILLKSADDDIYSRELLLMIYMSLPSSGQHLANKDISNSTQTAHQYFLYAYMYTPDVEYIIDHITYFTLE
jgi:hypothetical protein